MLDSGATCSIIDKEVFDEIPEESRPIPYNDSCYLKAGNGSVITNYGCVELWIDIQGVPVLETFYICDSDHSCILGMTFLENAGAVIDIGRKRVFLRNRSVRLHDVKGRPFFSKVIAGRTVHVPPGREVIIPGRVCSRRDSPKGVACLEPSMCTPRKTGALIAKVVVDTSKSTVPVRLFNPLDKTITIHQNATMGILSDVEEIRAKPDTTTDDSNNISMEEPLNPVKPIIPEHLTELYDRSSKELSEDEKDLLGQLLVDYSDIFSTGSSDIGRTDWVKHDIDTGDEPPFRQRPRRLPIMQQEALKEQIEDLKSRGLIRESTGPWASNVILVKKKDGSWRLCIDYRGVNAKTKTRDPFLLPRIDETLDALAGSQYYCTLDLCSGYHQCELTETSKATTAFITKFGHYEWEVLPFGLQNWPGTFQRLMNRVLATIPFDVAHCYLDDLVTHGRTVEECISRLRLVFDRLREAGLKLKPKKCNLFQRRVLGHVVSGEGVSCDPSKVEAVENWCAPRTLKQLRTFIGTVSYYKRFIKAFAGICRPLYNLTKAGQKFVWSTECEEAFEALKRRLVTAPIMAYPKPGVRYIVDTDSSGYAIGSVLSQIQDGEEKVISYGSRVLKPAEQKYCARRRELLAIVDSAIYYRPYLYGGEVLFRTDHFSLQFLRSLKDPNEQLSRWIEKLEEFHYEIQVRPGKNHANADGLSRLECGGKRCICEKVAETAGNELGVHCVRAKSSRRISKTEKSQKKAVKSIRWDAEWTDEEMVDAQQTDADIAPILRAKVDGDQRPSWEEISIESPATKSYWAEWDRLYLRGDLLYRKWESNNGKFYRFQLVLPKKYQEVALRNLHDARTSAHLGQRRTNDAIAQRFYWYKMRESVNRWCATCERCQRRKRPKDVPHAPMRVYNVGYPGERIAMDICGPFPITDRNNRYILVVADYFSKWTEMYAIPDQSAVNVASVFVNNWVVRWGCPRELHTD